MVQVAPLRRLTTGLLWIRVVIPERILSLVSWVSLLGTSGTLLLGESQGRMGHQVTRQAKTMMTRNITIMVLIAGMVLGAAATEGFNVYRQSHDSQIFQERARCKAVADAYVKENSTYGKESSTYPDGDPHGPLMTLDKVDYSPARNSCVAEFETVFIAGSVAFEYENVQDLLSGETLFSAKCTDDCEALKGTLVSSAFDYVINNASEPIDLEKALILFQSKHPPKSAPVTQQHETRGQSPR